MTAVATQLPLNKSPLDCDQPLKQGKGDRRNMTLQPVNVFAHFLDGQAFMRSMRRSSPYRNMLSLLIAMAVLLANAAMLSAHMPNRLSEAEQQRHQQLQMEVAEHGHSHDEGFDDEKHPGHHHGHDAADHSHDVPNMLSSAVMPFNPVVRDWRAGPPGTANPDPAFRLKRPPRVS